MPTVLNPHNVIVSSPTKINAAWVEPTGSHWTFPVSVYPSSCAVRMPSGVLQYIVSQAIPNLNGSDLTVSFSFTSGLSPGTWQLSIPPFAIVDTSGNMALSSYYFSV